MQPGGASGAGSNSADVLTLLAEAALSGCCNHGGDALQPPHANRHSARSTAGVTRFEPLLRDSEVARSMRP